MRSLVVAAFLLSLVTGTLGVERVHYVAAVEVYWDYVPFGHNMISDLPLVNDSDASVFLKRGPNRIGSVYKKALFREYTDQTYTVKTERPDWLGFLGPVFTAEVGDVITIHFKNLLPKLHCSMHPHGVLYDKMSEGSLYNDGTSGASKLDDFVPPNGTHTYTWRVREVDSPLEDDPDCLTWMYHSHQDHSRDIYTGLAGPLVICKKGALTADGHEKVDHEFVLLFSVTDENKSFYLEDNIQEFCTDPDSVDVEDEDFMESNLMHGINGYLYGNLPGLVMCEGDTVSWHLVGLGGEVDMHTVHFRGQSLAMQRHTADAISLFPASFITAKMEARGPGTWMVNCEVNDHYSGGMQALLNVEDCGPKWQGQQQQQQQQVQLVYIGGRTREYYIAAEIVYWDYGPSGQNLFDGGSLVKPDSDSVVFFETTAHRIGGRYKKVRFVEYEDFTFTRPKERTTEEKYQGILGPVIRSEVGDEIVVTFRNMADREYSIQPHGVAYDKRNEGSFYGDALGQKLGVLPNDTYTYRWTVPEDFGPAEGDPDCLTRFYRSGVDPVADPSSGLIGPLLVCRRGALAESGKQKNVDHEFFLLFSVIDENLSWYLDDNIREFCKDPDGVDSADADFAESNLMHAINGYMYGNLPTMRMCKGDNVSWHVIGLGTEVDIHTAVFHGQTLTYHQQYRDAIAVFPGTAETLSMVPDNVGEWALECRTNDHYSAGMKAKYVVEDCYPDERSHPQDLNTVNHGQVRTYYIAAVELEWDYAEVKEDVHGNPINVTDDKHDFLRASDTTIGSVYKKAVYREFTDGTFTQEVARPETYGLLGPIIRAEIGDVIVVIFRNLASRRFSLHPHGVMYDKGSEGALYQNGLRATGQRVGVGPGESKAYTWSVPERSGPTEADGNCVTWAYYSSVDPVRDTNSGLIGPLVVCRKGSLSPDGSRSDVNREFPLLFSVFDENLSWYIEDNVRMFCNTPNQVDYEDEDFQATNKLHAINGLTLGNLRGLRMRVGENVDWYLMGMGTEVDAHAAHFHGNSFTRTTGPDMRQRGDVWDLFPGTFATVHMTPNNPGTWLVHCHNSDHFVLGMRTTYTVEPAEA